MRRPLIRGAVAADVLAAVPLLTPVSAGARFLEKEEAEGATKGVPR
jgi:hypothetical protein